MKYDVSSGMFEYQISMYWLNQMYIQKQLKPSSSLPRSCRCSSREDAMQRAAGCRRQIASEITSGQRRLDHPGEVVDAPHRAEPHRLERHHPVDGRQRERDGEDDQRHSAESVRLPTVRLRVGRLVLPSRTPRRASRRAGLHSST